MIRTACTLAAALGLAAPALAEDWDFMLTNSTGKTIKQVEVSPAGAGSWVANKIDPEIQKERTIRNGGRMTVHFDKGSGCKYDVQITFDDGAKAVWTGINVCDNSYVTVNYANGTPSFKAS